MPEPTGPALILASRSPSRSALLAAAGLTFATEPANVDETEVKRSLHAEGADPAQVAETLAELKAMRIATRYPRALVIGADQMLACDGTWFDKPSTREEARGHLHSLRGRTHQLISAVVLAREGRRVWHHVDTARLTMRAFSDHFLDQYLSEVGDAVLSSVGGYQLEGRGVQLFSRIDGDFFTILGLPLLPLLQILREHGVVPR